MVNFHQVMLLGRLTSNPKLSYATNGIPVCLMTISVVRRIEGADDELSEVTLHFDVLVRRRLGEICAQFLKKGREVFVAGTLERKVDPGSKSSSQLRLVADTVQFLGDHRVTSSA